MIKKKKARPKTNVDTVRRVFSGIDQGNKFWKPKVGKNIIRILPSNREDGNVAYESIQHYGFKVEGKNRAFPCMAAFKKPCPVCKVIAHHDSDTDPDVQEILEKLKPSYAYLLNILVRGTGDKVLIYSAPKGVMSEIYHIFNDDDYDDITDEEEGRDIKIDRTGEGLATRYSVRVSPKTTPIDLEDWESGLFNLQKEAYKDVPSLKKYEEYLEDNFGNVLQIQAALGYEDAEEEEEDEEEEEPRPRKKKVLKKKAVVKKPVKKVVKKSSDDDDDIDDLFD